MCCRGDASCAPAAANWQWSLRPRAMHPIRMRRRDAMTPAITPLKTNAETGLAEAFTALRSKLADGAIAARREAAFRRFESQGLPHRRVEEWKYTDLRSLMRDAKPLAGLADAAARAHAKSAGSIFSAIGPRRIVFIDGSLAPELSDLAALEPGLKISS